MQISRHFVIVFTLLTWHGVTFAGPPHGIANGVWQKGHNITEPRPKSSKLMKTVQAGFLFFPHDAAYRAEIEVSSDVSVPYFMQALFENPLDPKRPFVEETVVSQPKRRFTLTHGPVT